MIKIQKNGDLVKVAGIGHQINNIIKPKIADFAGRKLDYHRRPFLLGGTTNRLENIKIINIKRTNRKPFFASLLKPLSSTTHKRPSLITNKSGFALSELVLSAIEVVEGRNFRFELFETIRGLSFNFSLLIPVLRINL